MMEKTGEIKEGVTPPEDDTKSASEEALENHLTTRAAKAVVEHKSKAQ